jgi:WD40 repeat protein
MKLSEASASASIPGHSQGVLSLATDPSGAILVSGDGAGAVRIWELRNRRLLARNDECKGPIWSLAVCQDRREIAFGGSDGAIRVWDPRTAQSSSTIHAATRRILCMRYDSDGQSLIWVGVEGRAFRINQARGSLPELLLARKTELKAADVDPAGRWIAVGDYLRNLELIDERDKLSKLEGHRREVCCLAFHRASKTLASGSRDCTVRIWDLEGGRQSAVLRGHQAPILSLAFGSDGRLLASGDAGGAVLVWDRVGQHQLAKYTMSPKSSADVLVFGNNGRVLAAGGTSSIVQLWDLPDMPGVQDK